METQTQIKPFKAKESIAVTLDNFIRAETDMYFRKSVTDGGFGKLKHRRQMADIDKQDVVRMNRDTIYSSGVFDLDAAPVTITLPHAGKRFMSMQIVSEDHFAIAVEYLPGSFTYTKEKIGTRYVFIIIRTLANPESSTDMKEANALQDAIKVEQAAAGSWEALNWDTTSQGKIREALNVLGSFKGQTPGNMFGTKSEVNPVLHLIGSAIGWGGNPGYAAVYQGAYPKANDGRIVHTITVKDVPVDGFWSLSVYNEKGFFEKNSLNAYSINNLTAKPNSDGSFTIQFGGCDGKALNCIPIMPGWNYTVRLYRPRKEILDGKWKFPEAQPMQ
jgi:para-nitrobenzyl esterase